MSAERVERRLAAILAADVAGYSRLIGQDEVDTLVRLRTHRRELIDAKIAEHKGRIVKTTGDGMLVEFASVVGALHCAIEVQAGMAARNRDIAAEQRIEFRVGIHQGDIVVEDGDIFGDGVNIAARLEGLAPAGGVCVSQRVQEDAAGRLDLAFEDLGEQLLKNISRPIRVYRVRFAEIPPTDRPAPLALPDKPSCAVLPFANMSSDPEQEYLGDGIAEDIITALSHYPSLFVIARNSSFTYKRHAVDVKQIGRDLGVRYVLEGSLRKGGRRIRVTAQLVEAETGNHVWADHYDRDLADIFAVQDEITRAVTIAVAPAIAEAERHRAMRKPPGNLDAWAVYQRGLWHLGKFTPDDNALSRRYFQQAIDLDPGFAGGFTGLAMADFYAAAVFAQRGLADMQRDFEVLARRAVALDGNDAEARSCLSWALFAGGDHAGARLEAGRALGLCPNLAAAHGALGVALIYSGQPEQGVTALETALRLDPLDPLNCVYLQQVSVGRYFAGEYAAAIEAAKLTIRSYPGYSLVNRWLAAALGQAERGQEAKQALAEAQLSPSFEVYVRQRPAWMRSQEHAHMLEGLRKAGWKG